MKGENPYVRHLYTLSSSQTSFGPHAQHNQRHYTIPVESTRVCPESPPNYNYDISNYIPNYMCMCMTIVVYGTTNLFRCVCVAVKSISKPNQSS